MIELRRLLLGFLLDSVWQVPLIVLIAVLCDLVLRRAGALARHRLWVGALFASVLLPLASSSGWYDAMFGGVFGSWREKSSSAITLRLDGGPDGVRLAGASAGVHFLGLSLGSVLLLVWLGFVLYRVACLVWAWRRTRVLVRDGRVAALPAAAMRAWEISQAHFGLRKTRLLVSDEMAAPAVVGVSRPVVLLPSCLLWQTTEAEYAAIFEHESAHIYRSDFLLNVLYEILAVPLIYHPATILLRSQITGSRELVCDELAANRLEDAPGYARSLLQIAKSLSGERRASIHALGIFEGGDLEGRIMNLVDRTRRFGRRAAAVVVALCCVFFGSCCVIASAFHFQPSVIAAEELKPFAGSWQWMFKDKPFVTMVLVPTGDHFTGYMTNGYFRNDDDGNMTEAGAYPGKSQVVRSFFAGSVLHIVVQGADKNLDEWTMTLMGPDKAQFDSADPERPKNMKPWMAVRVSDAVAPVGADRIYRVGGDVSAPKVISSVLPDFPPGYTGGFNGTCVVSVVVGADGVPQQVDVVKSLGTDFDQRATNTVKQYRFTPALRNGEPVAVRVKFEVNFRRF